MTTHMTRCILLALLAGTGSSPAFAQGTHEHGHGAHDRAGDLAHGHGSAASGELPRVKAEVRRVNTRAKSLSVRHDDIPNLDMPPMTMTFQVHHPALLEGLEVGDSILVTVDRIDGAYTVMSVEPAP